MLQSITPVLLTYNEAPNIARTLSHLAWAKDIVVVDSGSTDATCSILASTPNVRVFTRPFDSHARQWRFATAETGISTPWILRLDADYQVPPALVEEMAALDPEAAVSAYAIAFDYAIFARVLRTSLYPPNTLLLRQGRYAITDNGHTEAWAVEGPVRTLRARVVHDDWKSTEHFAAAQGRYMRREADKLAERRSGLRDWLRMRPPLMPIAVFFYTLFWKGLIFNGRAGLFYALQRTVAEAILSLTILEARLRDKVGRSRDDRD
jgi:glycosyltransferase involved in cell wall biosynthesis